MIPSLLAPTWKIGDPGANAVVDANVRLADKLRRIHYRRCRVPDCGYTISSEEASFALPEFLVVCEVCYYMYQALMSVGLKSPFYFRNLHEQWKKDRDDPKRRDRLGLP